MSLGTDLSPLQNAWSQAKTALCFIHPQSTYDAVAAALALQIAAQEAGIRFTVVCSAPMREEYSFLTGIESVSQEVGNRNLVISFPYQAEQVDKVSYNIDEQNARFELIIAPQTGSEPLTPQQISFSQSGLSADVIFLFGFHSFDELGEIYQKEQYTIDSAFTLAVTQGPIARYAKLHVALQPDRLSYSEWAYLWLQQSQQTVSAAAATNALSGIEYSTALLREVMNARTFDSVAGLLRSGAQRFSDNPAYESLATPIQHSAVMSAPASNVPKTTAPAPVRTAVSNGGQDKQDIFAAQQRPSGERT